MLTPTAGWEPKNIANLQAWEVIRDQLQETLAAIRAGRASALAFHMARNQMDVPLLAAYVGLPRWRVRRHLKPAVFARLKPALLERYAAVLEISVEELRTVPERIELPLPDLASRRGLPGSEGRAKRLFHHGTYRKKIRRFARITSDQV